MQEITSKLSFFAEKRFETLLNTRHPPDDATLDCDVIVIGGGPAGSTVSTLLKDNGYNVLVIEKSEHPRFHIGESLLPRNMPILRRLGVMDSVVAIGVKKMGADFSVSGEAGHKVYDFSKALKPDEPTAFQVTRAAFDEILLNNARVHGVDVMENTEAVNFRFGVDRVEVSVRETQGEIADNSVGEAGTRTLSGRFLIDASGRDTFLSSRMGLKKRDPRHSSAAVFSHFSDVEQHAGEEAGNISIYWFDHGWFWMIPLACGRTSVGMVCDPAFLKQRDGALADFLLEGFSRCPQVARRMSKAVALDETRAAGNFSYRSTQIFGDKFLMVGDAYAFIDPVFSSGVYIAMQSAEFAADAIHGCLTKPSQAGKLLSRYERRVKMGISGFSWFIYRFRDPTMKFLFMNPSNKFGIQSAVISVLSGDVFGRTSLWPRLALFRAIYVMVKTLDWLGLGSLVRQGK